MTDLRKLLSKNIKSRRKVLKLSQAELAEKVGTASNYISKIEALKQFPSVEMIEKIAAALEIDTVDLFHVNSTRDIEISEIEDVIVQNMRDEVHKQLARIK